MINFKNLFKTTMVLLFGLHCGQYFFGTNTAEVSADAMECLDFPSNLQPQKRSVKLGSNFARKYDETSSAEIVEYRADSFRVIKIKKRLDDVVKHRIKHPIEDYCWGMGPGGLLGLFSFGSILSMFGTWLLYAQLNIGQITGTFSKPASNNALGKLPLNFSTPLQKIAYYANLAKNSFKNANPWAIFGIQAAALVTTLFIGTMIVFHLGKRSYPVWNEQFGSDFHSLDKVIQEIRLAKLLSWNSQKELKCIEREEYRRFVNGEFEIYPAQTVVWFEFYTYKPELKKLCSVANEFLEKIEFAIDQRKTRSIVAREIEEERLAREAQLKKEQEDLRDQLKQQRLDLDRQRKEIDALKKSQQAIKL